jgi:chorismate synthase
VCRPFGFDWRSHEMTTDNIVYRTLNTIEEFSQVARLEAEIWEMPQEEADSPYIMQAITHNGGVVIGAEIDGRLIGFALALPGRRGDSWLLWSHATGVVKAYQGQGIGFALKQAQRDWALAHGYSIIAWTFDPMQRGNANFNIRKLGATVHTYFVNHYGVMTDGINAGMPSDRVEAVWRLQDERVIAHADGNPTALVTDYPEEAFLLRHTGDALVTRSVRTDVRWNFVEIPFNLQTLKAEDIEQAKAWQLALRKVMLSALDQGYTVVDFVTEGARCWYVLTK